MGFERIALQGAGGEWVPLVVRPPDPAGAHQSFSQRLLMAAPDGEHLLYAAARGQLRVRGPAGDEFPVDRVEERDARFSADSRWLATVTAIGPDEDVRADVTVVDVTGHRRRSLGQVDRPMWLEWVRDGVVVLHVDAASGQQALTYLPLAGRPRLLVTGHDLVPRFTAAARGTRVMYFIDTDVFTMDVTGGEPERAGTLPDTAPNVEMSPDGSQAALATSTRLYRWTEARGLEVLQDGEEIHTVWYSPGGHELAYASRSAAVVLTDGGKRHELRAPGNDLAGLRFRRGGDGLVVVRGDRVLLWRPAASELRTLAVGPPGQTVRAADVFAGGTALWTTTAAPPVPAANPPPSQQAR